VHTHAEKASVRERHRDAVRQRAEDERERQRQREDERERQRQGEIERAIFEMQRERERERERERLRQKETRDGGGARQVSSFAFRMKPGCAPRKAVQVALSAATSALTSSAAQLATCRRCLGREDPDTNYMGHMNQHPTEPKTSLVRQKVAP
jgi:hypothetical protein